MADKPDISGQITTRTWQRGNYVYRETLGELGIPGQVKKHASRSEHMAVSRGTGGHASQPIASEFGASVSRKSMTIQNPNINTWTPKRLQGKLGKGGSYRELELRWRRMLEDGYRIRARVRDVFKLGEKRPFKRVVDWVALDENGSEILADSPPEPIFGNFSSPQEREALAKKHSPIPSAPKPHPSESPSKPTPTAEPPLPVGETEPLLPLERPPLNRYSTIPTVTTRLRRALRQVVSNEDAVALLGVGIGDVLIWLNQRGVSKQVQEQLNGRHAKAIRNSFEDQKGVLVIVRVKTFAPLIESVPIEELIGVDVVSGTSLEDCYRRWISEPKLMQGVQGPEWSTSEMYGWLSPPQKSLSPPVRPKEAGRIAPPR